MRAEARDTLDAPMTGVTFAWTSTNGSVALIDTAGRFVAYMTFPNWMTVFLLGCWQRQRESSRSREWLPYRVGCWSG